MSIVTDYRVSGTLVMPHFYVPLLCNTLLRFSKNIPLLYETVSLYNFWVPESTHTLFSNACLNFIDMLVSVLLKWKSALVLKVKIGLLKV